MAAELSTKKIKDYQDNYFKENKKDCLFKIVSLLL